MPYSNSVSDNSQNYAASNLPINLELNALQFALPNFPMGNVSNSAPYTNVNLSANSNPVNQQQEALQALLSLAAKLPLVNNSEQNNQPTYVNISDIDMPFFAGGSQTTKHLHKHRREEEGDLESEVEETLEQLLEQEKESEKVKEEINENNVNKDGNP
ncbi:hypothetical protein C2G38_2177808 [Gigaspora rosea]|uniref:Uncharacterized protein n=1 Tax=Gigaspora rosea TaxID=44941 RepID=A0A397VGA8_9GLOM|nr:hypothetical protein C2G38_2177808 [Gigaspora rosea]